MRTRVLLALTAAVMLALGGGYYYHRTQVTTTTVRQAKASVDTLYRNLTHTLPATDLNSARVAKAKQAVQAAAKQRLDAQQKKQLHQAQQEVAQADQMLTVVGATQAPIAPTTDYRQTAAAALSAYAQLETTEPVFTQVYQQPVTTLNSAATAVSALQKLQTAPKVTPKAITTAESAVNAVTNGDDSAFAAEAEAVVSAAKQKLTPESAATTTDAPSETEAAASSSQPVATAETAANTTTETAETANATTASSRTSTSQPAATASSATAASD